MLKICENLRNLWQYKPLVTRQSLVTAGESPVGTIQYNIEISPRRDDPINKVAPTELFIRADIGFTKSTSILDLA